MKWYDRLYIGDSIKEKEKKIKWKIDHRIPQRRIYVIAFASNPDNLLDMIPASNLRQKGYPKEHLKIIGLAKGYDEGIGLIVQIIDETYHATGTVDVYAYLKESRGNA